MSAPVLVGRTTRAILDGAEDVSTWSDEELIMGQRQSRRGRFEGKPPQVVSGAILQELRRRQCEDAYVELGDKVKAAAEYVGRVITGEEAPDRHRLHACEMVFNRVLGKEPQRVELALEQTPFQESLGKVFIKRTLSDAKAVESPNNEYDKESLRRATAIDVEPKEPDPAVDLTEQDQRSGRLRRKKKVWRQPDGTEVER